MKGLHDTSHFPLTKDQTARHSSIDIQMAVRSKLLSLLRISIHLEMKSVIEPNQFPAYRNFITDTFLQQFLSNLPLHLCLCPVLTGTKWWMVSFNPFYHEIVINFRLLLF